MKYIDSEKLIAEIERRIKDCKKANGHFKPPRTRNAICYDELADLLEIIHSLHQEQPEADLDREIIKYKVPFADDREYLNETTLDAIARHFAEWGAIHLNARKEESK